MNSANGMILGLCWNGHARMGRFHCSIMGMRFGSVIFGFGDCELTPPFLAIGQVCFCGIGIDIDAEAGLVVYCDETILYVRPVN